MYTINGGEQWVCAAAFLQAWRAHTLMKERTVKTENPSDSRSSTTVNSLNSERRTTMITSLNRCSIVNNINYEKELTHMKGHQYFMAGTNTPLDGWNGGRQGDLSELGNGWHGGRQGDLSELGNGWHGGRQRGNKEQGGDQPPCSFSKA